MKASTATNVNNVFSGMFSFSPVVHKGDPAVRNR
ncbi:unnamed protein product, partial [Urochloa humidicola]